MTGGPRRHLRTVLRLASSLALLALMAWLCDPVATWHAMRRAHLPALLGALTAYVASMGIVAWRWQMLLQAEGHQVDIWRLFRYYLIGFFFNNFLPSSVGGDIVRIVLVRRSGCAWERALSSVFVERLLGFLAMTALAVSSMALLAKTFAALPVVVIGTLVLALVFIGITLICFNARAARLAERLIARVRWSTLSRLLQLFFQSVYAYRAHRSVLVYVFLVSLLYQVVLGGVTYWIMQATGLHAPFLLIFALMQVTSMLGVIPITLETTGVREGLYVLVLANMMGYDRALTLAAIVLVRVVSIMGSALGGIAFALEGVRIREVSVAR
ncbi:MAG: flippase-like domain-containing protein [bacterium]|nr:flippase-like domain-containing protein [bacterium]